MTVCIDDWATEKAAQLWCLPTTSKIEMDVVLALEIAQALRDERERCAKTAEHFTGSLWDASEVRLASQIVKAIRG